VQYAHFLAFCIIRLYFSLKVNERIIGKNLLELISLQILKFFACPIFTTVNDYEYSREITLLASSPNKDDTKKITPQKSNILYIVSNHLEQKINLLPK